MNRSSPGGQANEGHSRQTERIIRRRGENLPGAFKNDMLDAAGSFGEGTGSAGAQEGAGP